MGKSLPIIVNITAAAALNPEASAVPQLTPQRGPAQAVTRVWTGECVCVCETAAPDAVKAVGTAVLRVFSGVPLR